MKPQPGLSKQMSRESITDAGNANVSLWAESVPAEKRRQEAINEVIYTERDFVRDLEYLRDVSGFVQSLGNARPNLISVLGDPAEGKGHYSQGTAAQVC